MKRLFLFLILAVFAAKGISQDNPCGMRWSNWATALTSNAGGVTYAVQYSKCSPSTGICGWPKIGLMHSFPSDATIDLHLKGTDCDGKIFKASFSTGGNAIGANTEYKSQGNWHYFKTVTGVVRVEVRYTVGEKKYRILIDKEQGINQTWINGKTAGEYQQEAAAKKRKEQEDKDAALLEEKNKQKEAADTKSRLTAEKKEAEKKATKKKLDQQEEERLAAIERKRVQDSIDNENSRRRVEAVQATDKAEDKTMAAAAAGVIGIAATMNDDYADGFAYLKYNLGLGWDNIPLIANNDADKSSSSEATSHPVIQIGLKAGFFNNKGISLHLSPFFSYGLNALSPGETGSHLSYGGFATLLLSTKADARLKLFAEGGYIARSGNWSYDLDAALAGSQYSTGGYTNVVKNATYDYKAVRYGGGIMLHWIDEKETFIKPGFFIEQPYPVKTTVKPTWVANLQVLASSFLTVDLSYSKNFYCNGVLNYPGNFATESKDYFSIKIIKSGSLFQ